MAKLNLAKVLESAGMAAKTAKGTATRIVNKQELDRDEDGLLEVGELVEALKTTYGDESSSKYRTAVTEIVAKIEAGEVEDEWETATAPTEKSTSPFIKAKAFDAVVKFATDKGIKEVVDLANSAVAKLIEEAEAKKAGK